jgi:hypothetical protein
MLGTGVNRLLFPRLRFVQQDTMTTQGATRTRPVELYRLDWTAFDNSLKERHDRRLEKHHPGVFVPFISGLPPLYDGYVQGYHFALDNYYIDEIRRCARQADSEWTTQRAFDTMIRDLCLEPAIAYVMVAFKLLADCIYDPDTQYFSRCPDRYYAAHAMAHKFWHHQTGRGVVDCNARIPELRARIAGGRLDEDTAKSLSAFLDALDAHYKTYKTTYAPLYESRQVSINEDVQ